MPPLSRSAEAPHGGFTMVELLVVVSIMALMAVAAVPSVHGLMAAGTINRAVAELAGRLEGARSYAMANNTYTRVALGNVGTGSGQSLAVVSIFSVDGSDTADMGAAANWPVLNRSLVLPSLLLNDSLNAAAPDTSQDGKPSQSTLGTMTRAVLDQGAVQFSCFIEFTPSGEARLDAANSIRFIKVAVDQPSPRNGSNPFILRLSGINGALAILRKENLSP